METIAATYVHLEDAARAVHELERFLGRRRVYTLTAASPIEEILAIPTTNDMPPVGRAILGMLGATVTAGLVAALPFSLPAVALGTAAAAGVGGLAGYWIGDRLDRETFRGMPVDERFVYEDATRKGRTVVIALTRAHREDAAVRRVYERTGAEVLDAARKSWWLGIRDAEAARYEQEGLGDFAADEIHYRKGYEAALVPDVRGRTFDVIEPVLRNRHPEDVDVPAFRFGFERGQAYLEEEARSEALR